MDKSASAIKDRKLTVGELASLTIEILRENAAFAAAAALAVFVPWAILMAMSADPFDYIMYAPRDAASSAGFSLGVSVTDWKGFALSFLPILGLNVVFPPLFTSAATFIAKRHVEGAPRSAAGLMDATLSKWGKLTFTTLLYNVIVFVGSLLIVPGLYLTVLYTFYVNHMADSPDWGFKALRGAAVYVKGQWMDTLGFIILVYAVSGLLTTLAQDLLMLIFGSDTGAVGFVAEFFVNLVGALIGAVFTMLTAVWFLNRKYLRDASPREARV